MKLKLKDIIHLNTNTEWLDGGYTICAFHKLFLTKEEAQDHISEINHLPFSIIPFWQGMNVNTQGPPSGYYCQLNYWTNEEAFIVLLNKILKELPYIKTYTGPIVFHNINVREIIK